jgi:hypothetical protein
MINNRKPSNPTASYLDVFTVETFESQGKTVKRWIRIGVAFPHKDGAGFSVELRALPLDGKLVILPPDAAEESKSN